MHHGPAGTVEFANANTGTMVTEFYVYAEVGGALGDFEDFWS